MITRRSRIGCVPVMRLAAGCRSLGGGPMVDGFAEKIDELVERSKGRIRADKAHETLLAMGYLGSPPALRVTSIDRLTPRRE